MIGLGLQDGLQGSSQVWPLVEGWLAKVLQRLEVVGEVEGADHVELLHRRAVVEQLQQMDLGGAQVHDGRLDLRFVLHTQQLDAIEIDLGDVSGAEAVPADLDDVVVVGQVGPGQFENCLCL